MTSEKSYVLYLSSVDKISGTNNNATFNINFDAFLPDNYFWFKINYSFNTLPGYYKTTTNGDQFSNCRIECDFSRGFSYDTKTNGPSKIIGYGDIVYNSLSNPVNSFVGDSRRYLGKTISKPQTGNITISIYNDYTLQLLTDTDSSGNETADMTYWNMVLEFIPIK